MTQSIMEAAQQPKSVTNNKSQNEGLASYFASRASWAALATAAIGTGAGAVLMAYNYATSSNPVDNAKDTLGEWA